MNHLIVIALTLLCMHNLEFMTTSKPVTTNERTTEQLKEVIEQHKPDNEWMHEFNDYQESSELDII